MRWPRASAPGRDNGVDALRDARPPFVWGHADLPPAYRSTVAASSHHRHTRQRACGAVVARRRRCLVFRHPSALVEATRFIVAEH